MLDSLWTFMVVPALCCALMHFIVRRTWSKRIQDLEHDLQRFSEAMCQMAEVQMRIYRKLSGNLGDIEERILELSVPSNDSNLPLERRHQVLALARKGVSLDEIVKRLGIPRGEAELILSLREYIDATNSRTPKSQGEAKLYAQV